MRIAILSLILGISLTGGVAYAAPVGSFGASSTVALTNSLHAAGLMERADTSAPPPRAAHLTDEASVPSPLVLSPDNSKPLIVTRDSLKNSSSASVTADTPAAHALALLQDDPALSSVSLSSEQIALSYNIPSRLFGFLTIRLPVHIAVTATGTARVSYPWYSFLFATDQVGLSVRAQSMVENQLHDSSTEMRAFTPKARAATASSTTDTLSAAEQVELLDSLHAVLTSQANATLTTPAP